MSFDHTKTPEQWREYQCAALRKQLAYARKGCRFYRDIPDICSLGDIGALPFTTAQDVARRGAEMVCIPGSEIKRIVTLKSSGTLGERKRLFFSQGDLERTVTFFKEGMSALCGAGDEAVIFMPGEAEDSVGRLLARGLAALGARPHIFGPIADFAAAAAFMRGLRPHTVIGIPSQIRRLCLEYPDAAPQNALLSADCVSRALRETIERKWGCEVFEHYGLTESGLGCAVECGAHSGLHIRMDELFVEIIDPKTGAARGEGELGEIVLSTLAREAMPLLRYRTGDVGRLLPGRCACGSGLARLDTIRGRLSELQKPLPIYVLDELLFGLDSVLDFSAKNENEVFKIYIDGDAEAARGALFCAIPGDSLEICGGKGFFSRGTAKRHME